jgi:hypothetical protein
MLVCSAMLTGAINAQYGDIEMDVGTTHACYRALL